MLLALIDNRRTEPSPGARAECPFCRTPVTAKCGTLKSWHWAHLQGSCDSWLAPDTEWTTWWKSQFPQNQQEVLHNGRVADIKTPQTIIELVQLGLVPDQITERESLFAPMIWLVDASKARITIQPDPDGFVRFTWSKPKTNWLHATMPVVLDLGPIAEDSFSWPPQPAKHKVLRIQKMRTNMKGAIRGWGYLKYVIEV